ncbi:Uu.00g136750.m01.CDS01 [Anthostomella pinea]|uniref:Uu.00g136750.m01.CDS01 n=1 Tax=Anthostomella pinea TaxID=933095 RepID=A0AAI8VIY5_9PEZI|nr:Uu.00g136750.m01.CDS01 [Anthostomella pinea]
MANPHMTMPDGQVVDASGCAPSRAPGFVLGPTHDPNTAVTAPYLAHGNYSTYMPYPLFFQTHGHADTMAGRSDNSAKDVPALENHRFLYPTNEPTPAMPFFGPTRDPAARVSVFDRSSYMAPSAQQIISGGAVQQPKGFYDISMPFGRGHHALLRRERAIPGAVPAIFTPQESMKKTLDQRLVNHIPGNRNLYFCGPYPIPDDKFFLKYAPRFGNVETSKAIIDTATGDCYKFDFARESFNSRLKAEGNDYSTNLYISNLPKSLIEAELGAVFLGYTILSSKILCDSIGNSRCVGFARFESRELCNEIIERFNGVKLGCEGLPMQIRYADTQAQKELKCATSGCRQFKTKGYKVRAYGTPRVGLSPTIYNQPRFRPDQNGAIVFGPSGPPFGNSRGQVHGGMGGITILSVAGSPVSAY